MTSIANSNSVAPLNGLVLAGGKSVRMGRDKGLLRWHGVEQRYYMAGLLTPLCSGMYLSCRQEQVASMGDGYHVLPDAFANAGPLGGILTAFQLQPQSAWLVAACDLPLLDAATLQFLIAHRDAQALATTFQSPFDGLPEPLITIWEPAAQPLLMEYLAAGISCPRKVLLRNIDRVKVLTPPNADALMNANTPEDAAKVEAIIAAGVK